ncbi:hypothetical protein DNTS_009253 [Danionella cerebrum]|uniref:Uncharacterized protein n=1 Tax=Danionella cerebrum TaxID=2873325 RepID=A0A553Q5I9_9TELE|nr:hypothetical protein DNTS_009253 [Danionella translucida]
MRSSSSAVRPLLPDAGLFLSPSSQLIKHVHLCKVRVNTRSGPCWFQGAVQTPLCLGALQARCQLCRGQPSLPATVSPFPGCCERFSDERCKPRRRHSRQVHRRWCCHGGSGRFRSWYWNSVRQSHHWIRQEPISEAAAVLIRHLRVRPV